MKEDVKVILNSSLGTRFPPFLLPLHNMRMCLCALYSGWYTTKMSLDKNVVTLVSSQSGQKSSEVQENILVCHVKMLN